MNDYKKIEITDIMNNPSVFDNESIEITGIARGINSHKSTTYNLGTGTSVSTVYMGFLQEKENLLAICSTMPGHFRSAHHLAMLQTSNETGLPITLQGTLRRLSKETAYIYNNAKLPYRLEVDELAFANYLTQGYQIRDNTND